MSRSLCIIFCKTRIKLAFLVDGIYNYWYDIYIQNYLLLYLIQCVSFKYQEELRTVNEINKRNLGMMIIHHVGHEGSEDKHGLRRLLQTCIDFLQTRTADVWRNASITIYDEDNNMYKIGSGEMKHQFICQMSNGEPFINDKMSVSSGSTYRHCAETTDDPTKQGYKDKCLVS